MEIAFELNGEMVTREVAPTALLRDVLRDECGRTDVKSGCLSGRCGVCTVLFNGRAVKSCLLLAAKADGQTVTTVGGLSSTAGTDEDGLHPVQDAFISGFAAQCGYCTPGFVMTAVDYVENTASPDDTREDIRHAIKGNVCRCTGYAKIVDAVGEVIETLPENDNQE